MGVISTHAMRTSFRQRLTERAPLERDAWIDRELGLPPAPDDDPRLPAGCVPYMPCPVDTLVQLTELASIQAHDVFVDIGAGIGRAAVLVHLLTGATTIGIEIQPRLVSVGREIVRHAQLSRVSMLEGDAVERIGEMHSATVFFLYCPFGAQRLERVLDSIERLTVHRPVRLACLNVPLPRLDWLELVAETADDLVIYRRRD